MPRTLPEDVVFHIAFVVARMSRADFQRLVDSRADFSRACAHNDVGGEDRALARVCALIAPPLPDSVGSLNQLDSYTNSMRRRERGNKRHAATVAAREADLDRLFHERYREAKQRTKLSTPLAVARRCGLDVNTVTRIEASKKRPPQKIIDALRDSLGLTFP